MNSRTELTDSLLHSDKKRVLTGAFFGLVSGCIMILVSTLVTPLGASQLWWIQMAASIFYGGQAMASDAPQSILIAGFIWHFAISLFLGLMVGKITTSSSLPRLASYGLVLGGLCWLASNMFGPDLFNISALDTFPQWTRMLVFQSFTLSLAVMMTKAPSQK